jgi:hypothetical protein
MARARPINLGNRYVEPPSGIKPMRRKAWRKYAEVEANTKSPMRAKLMPTPAAGPLTAVTKGMFKPLRRCRNGW